MQKPHRDTSLITPADEEEKTCSSIDIATQILREMLEDMMEQPVSSSISATAAKHTQNETRGKHLTSHSNRGEYPKDCQKRSKVMTSSHTAALKLGGVFDIVEFF